MICSRSLSFFTLILSSSAGFLSPGVLADTRVAGKSAAVATVHEEATRAALDILRDGGNAVDAAVAAGFVLGVVDGHNSGLGGGCFLLVRTAGGETVCIDGRETAPAAASRDMFLDAGGKAVPERSRVGPLASGVPGAVAAYALVREKYGSLPLARLVEPAAVLAEEGFVLGERNASMIRNEAENLARFEGSREVLLDADGEPWPAGHRLVQKDLATTLRGIASEGPGYFYRGPVAESVARWMEANGGLITAADFAAYRAVERPPVRSRYRGHEILGFPPPSSGGVHVAQILNIVERFPLAEMNPAARAHHVGEAMKLAFADRAHWLGDSDFVPVPRNLISPDYARELGGRIDPASAGDVSGHGRPPAAATEIFRRHTTHFCVADALGNWVACTATINTTFGSKVIAPGTGVVLNNEMDDFAIAPGVPNAFGLLGSDANAVEAGKRPLSSMSPTIVLRDGRPVFSVGAAGGPTIISQVVLALIGRIDLGMSAFECIRQPRFHHQWRPDALVVEKGIDEPIRRALNALGHTLSPRSTFGVSQAIGVGEDGKLEAAADPRADGVAGGL